MISSTTWVAARVDRNVTPMREKHIFFIVSGGRHSWPSVGRNREAWSHLTPLILLGGSTSDQWDQWWNRALACQGGDSQERDQGLRIKAKAVASSITGLWHINSPTALRMEEHISSALVDSSSRRRSFTRSSPNSGSTILSSFPSHSTTPRETNSKAALRSIATMGASEVAWEKRPSGKPVEAISTIPVLSRRSPEVCPALL